MVEVVPRRVVGSADIDDRDGLVVEVLLLWLPPLHRATVARDQDAAREQLVLVGASRVGHDEAERGHGVRVPHTEDLVPKALASARSAERNAALR